MRKYKRVFVAVILIGLVLLTFLPRLLSLDRHWASDEDLWMMRSRNFAAAMQSGKFSETYQKHHPGVTTMWLGSIVLWLTSDGSILKSDFLSQDFFTSQRLARIRLPVAIVTGCLIFLVCFCVYRLFGGRPAVLSTAFLAVEPFLLSESRRAHTDALTSLFLFLSLLLWLCYLEGAPSKRRDLIFSGISFGLACLTKSHACGFFLFLPLLLVWYRKQQNLSTARLLWSALLWGMVTLLTVLLIFPYMWTLDQFLILSGMGGALLVWSWRSLSGAELPQLTATALEVLFGLFGAVVIWSIAAGLPIFEEMFGALTTAHDLPKLFLGDVRHNPGWLYFPVVFGVWSGVLTLPLIGFAMYGAYRQWKVGIDKTLRITVILSLFCLFYLLGLSIVAKKISRYLLIFLPAISVLTALGAMHLSKRFTRKWVGYALLFSIFLFQVVPVLRLHPYYRTYYHPFLCGSGEL